MDIRKIKPVFNRILVTANTYEIDNSELITEKEARGALKEIQRVIEVGDAVRNIKEGDLIKIDPSAYVIKKFRDGSIKNDMINQEEVIGYRFNTVELNDIPYLLITDRDVEYIVLEANS